MSADLPFKTTMEFTYGEPAGMAPGVSRLVANNPSSFTFKGTNTYLVGSLSLAVIDPGPADDAHLDAIMRAAAGRPITHILVTHAHRDHVDGVARLRSVTGAKLVGFGRSQLDQPEMVTGPSGREFVDSRFQPQISLSDGDVVSGEDWSLEALHTPGHAPDHLCFALNGTGIVFSGDHVMAWSTTVIAPPEGSMADYYRSLEALLSRPATSYFPGHGGRIDEPVRVVKAYLLHRRWRERAIRDAIGDGDDTINKVVALIYPGIESALVMAATLSVRAHVEHLIDRGEVFCEGPLSVGARLFVRAG